MLRAVSSSRPCVRREPGSEAVSAGRRGAMRDSTPTEGDPLGSTEPALVLTERTGDATAATWGCSSQTGPCPDSWWTTAEDKGGDAAAVP